MSRAETYGGSAGREATRDSEARSGEAPSSGTRGGGAPSGGARGNVTARETACGSKRTPSNAAPNSAPPRSTLLNAQALAELAPAHTTVRCGKCPNNCLLTINSFGTDPATGRSRRFITGNRCEKGAGTEDRSGLLPNLFAWKRERLFKGSAARPYIPLTPAKAPRPTVGIPRVLNMYENYPFWFTLLTELGFATVLSCESSKAVYEAGIESMPSESVCYPAKLSHGHIMDLLHRGDIDFIFHPCIRYERMENTEAQNHFNCPVVVSYPEVLKLNVEEIHPATAAVPFLNPFLPYDHRGRLAERIGEVFAELWRAHPELKGSTPTLAELRRAVAVAWDEDDAFKADIHRAGEEALAWMEQTGTHGIVLAGRPYHLDTEINHSIPEMVAGFGLAVLTEDSVAHLIRPERPLRVIDQWMFHTRLYAAAKLCTLRDDLDLIQLNSFGCGLDAITTDQVQEILEGAGKLYTVLKIDEVSNLGAARIRVRSLLAALRGKNHEQQNQAKDAAGDALRSEPPSTAIQKPRYTKRMKDEGYTILSPQMAPIHFELLIRAFEQDGYNLELLPSVDPAAVEAGLKFTNNDICYPSILVTGQIMEAVTSGRYDLDRTAVIITQTGGGCRATNYIALIRKALREAGYPQIPVIALSFHDIGGEQNPGFRVSLDLLRRAAYAFFYGDLLMACLYRTRPYEAVPGSANALYRHWMDVCSEQIAGRINRRIYRRTAERIVEEFDTLPLVNDRSKPRVGVVGEILVKFHPTANNGIVEVLEAEGCEVVVPGLTEFFLFGISNSIWQNRELAKPFKSALGSRAGVAWLNWMRSPILRAQERSARFTPPASIYELAAYASEVISLCNSMGEGWLLTAEMLELIHGGTPNIVCAQPFACLPNHVTGKGVIKELRRLHPTSNIVPVDYDPGASEVNQLNRIKLMIAVAKDNFEAERGGDEDEREDATAANKEPERQDATASSDSAAETSASATEARGNA